MSDSVTRYVRYGHERGVSYGILDGETIKEIDGGLFGERAPTGKTISFVHLEPFWLRNAEM